MKQVIIIFITLFSIDLFSQSVGIGTTTPDSSAILDLSSTDKGFLLPRMTTSQRDAISVPVQGLKIFNTDDNCEHIWNGEQWNRSCGERLVMDTIRPGNTWKELSPIPNVLERLGMVSFAFGNKIIVALGREAAISNTEYYNDVWEYDVDSKVWIQKSDFPGVGRNAAFSFVYNGLGYIVGGSGGSGIGDLDEVWQYNPLTDTWVQKGDFPTGSRRYLVGFVINDKAYMGTGDGVNPYYENDFWEYNPTNDTWIQKAPLPGVGRLFATGFSIGNLGYIGMGRGPTASDYLNDIYVYDPISDLWDDKQDFLANGGPLTSFVIKDTAYVGLGTIGNDILPSMYKFNPSSSGNQWTQIEDFPGIPRTSAFSQVLNAKGYIGCGLLDDPNESIIDLWVYNPLPDTLQTSIQQIQENTFSVVDHAWTSIENTKLYTTQNFSKVGLGTYNPKVKLHIEGNNDAGTGDNSGLLLVGNIDGGNIVIDNNEIIARDNGVVSPLYIQKASGSLLDIGGNVDIAENVDIGGNVDITGNIGIGTIPSTTVPVLIQGGSNAGLSSTAGYLVIGPTSGANVVFDNNEIQARSFGGSANLVLQKEGGDLTIDADNFKLNIGVGTNALTVYSNDTPPTIGKYTGSGWGHSSDRIMKTNISTLSNALDKILQLRGVSFNWKGNPTSNNQIGFIAQEVEPIFPEAVSKDENGIYSMTYQNLVAPLVEAIKEQQVMIEELKASLQQTQSSNETQSAVNLDLKSRLEKLENLLSQIDKQ